MAGATGSIDYPPWPGGLQAPSERTGCPLERAEVLPSLRTLLNMAPKPGCGRKCHAPEKSRPLITPNGTKIRHSTFQPKPSSHQVCWSQ